MMSPGAVARTTTKRSNDRDRQMVILNPARCGYPGILRVIAVILVISQQDTHLIHET